MKKETITIPFERGRKLDQHIVFRHKLRVLAEFSVYGVVGLSLAQDRLRHVCLHLVEALTEPALGVTEAADHAVLQNAVQIFRLGQVVEPCWSGYFYIGHIVSSSLVIADVRHLQPVGPAATL